MRQSVRMLGGLALLATLLVVPVAAAQSEQLRKALDMFERQEYAAAQAALAEVNREDLSKDEQAEYDRLQQTLPLALAGIQRATQDAVEADLAFEQSRWDDADARYRAVLENEFATAILKARATIQRQRIDEKRRLAEAAAPTAVIPAEPKAAPKPPLQPSAVPQAPAQPAAPARLTPLDEMKLRDSLLWQRAVAQADELGRRAREAVEKRDFTTARQLAEAALQKIEAARNYAEPVDKYLAAKEAAERLKREVEQSYSEYQRLQAEKERTEILERTEKRRELQEKHRREKVEQLLNTAAQLRKQQRFEEAAEVLRQVRYIDPTNVQARYQLEIVEDYASLLAQREWHHDVYTQTRTALTNAQEALIPWDYEVLYPKNWLELTAKRSQAGLGVGDEGPSAELERRLDEILPQFEFQEAPLETVMGYLRDAKDVNLSVDWEDLSSNGIDPDKPVSLSLRNLPFRTVLREVLAQVGGDVPLTFTVADGLVRVATKNKLDRDKYVLVYDIRDLLVNVARFPSAAHLDPAHNLYVQPDIQPKGLFESPRGQPARRNNPEEDDRQELIDKLMSVIRQHVEPNSWQDTGNGDASIRELNGQLVVYQTSRAHVEVRGLLDQLRARRALQIALEARFLDVTSNFLEEFGVDLDFVFNSASAGYDRGVSADGRPVTDPFSGAPVLVPRQFTRTGVTPLAPNYGQPIQQGTAIVQPYNQPGFVPYTTGVSPHISEMTPISAQQSSLSLTDPSGINTTVPGSFAQRGALNPALNIVGSFLDNLQVDFLIRATQANGRSAIVQAPRLVMENWSQCYIQVGRFRDYVSSINATVAEGAALPEPVIQQASSGVTLSVFGVISHDRRYVTVNVNATQAEEPQLERFEVQRASGNSPGVFISLRDQRFITVRTQVAIPDGGTVLLGGLKQVGEVEIEAGVPILSKVPVIKRFFSNRTTVKDTRTLLILMKVKIIIQSEAEEQAFPTFSSLAGG